MKFCPYPLRIIRGGTPLERDRKYPRTPRQRRAFHPTRPRMPSEQCPSRTGVESLSSNEFYSRFATLNPTINKIRHTARNRKKRNFAIPAAAVAIPVKPKSAATSAITKNITAQRNTKLPPSSAYSCVLTILRAQVDGVSPASFLCLGSAAAVVGRGK
jgi:hypothetical protein